MEEKKIGMRHILIFALCLVVVFVGIDLMMKKPTVSTTTSVYQTKTQVFSGQTPSEALVEWKADFLGRSVTKWEVGLDDSGQPVELKIWYK